MPNASPNVMIWNLVDCPYKCVWVETLETAVFDAVFVLNDTQALCLKMMQALGIKKPGQCCVEWVNRENDRILKTSYTKNR